MNVNGQQRNQENSQLNEMKSRESETELRKASQRNKERLQFSQNKLYGREKELRKLQRCYAHLHGRKQASVDGNPQFPHVVFLSGRSGSGKSALVREFTNTLKRKQMPYSLMNAKYSELKTAVPFSAITEEIGRWCKNLSKKEELSRRDSVRKQLYESIGDDVHLLVELIPDFSKLVFGGAKADELSTSSRISSSSSRYSTSFSYIHKKMNMTKLKYIFASVIRSLCTPQCPLILFVDDMQWADNASLDLLQGLLVEGFQSNFLFVGAFRSNEVEEDHPLATLVDDLASHRNVTVMELAELSRKELQEFIADTLEWDEAEAQGLAGAIFSTTEGNINHAIQALESLVRNGVLHYDMNSWQCFLSINELEDKVSESVMEMIKAKINHMSPLVQQILVISSYIHSNFDVGTLVDCIETVGIRVTNKDLVNALDKAVLEGLLVSIVAQEEYAFAHDSIQEVARRLAHGEELQKLSIRLGRALSNRGFSDTFGEDWMLFTAARHWNSVRKVSLWPHTDEDKVDFARLNMATARIAISVAGYDNAAKLLRTGVDCLDPDDRWDEFYGLTIKLYHLLMDTEVCLGNFDRAREYVGQVLEHAKTVQDKAPAFVHSLGIIMQGKDRNHDLALKKGVGILAWLGIKLTADPHDVQPEDIEQEELRCSLALEGRQIMDLQHSPPIEDETVLCVIEKMAKASVYSGKVSFAYILGQVAIRICAQDGVSEFLPRIYMYSQFYFRKGNLKLMAYDCAVTCQDLVGKLSGVSVEGSCMVMVTCNNGLQLFGPCLRVVDIYQECYLKCLRSGETEFAFLIANSYALSFLVSGVPITAHTEKEFSSVEKECRRFKQPASVYSNFMIYRQLVLNLQGKSNNPVQLDGLAMTEEGVLSCFDPDTALYKQTRRELSSCKMMAACIFNDLSTMEAMIENQKTWPDFDILLHRMNMRLVWLALGSFALARAKRGKKYAEMGKKYLKLYKEDSKLGNPNARVTFLCLQAESKQTKENYNLAIEACRELRSLHLEALMNEHCGKCQLERGKHANGERYLMQALELYHDYGAIAKVKQMKKSHVFLKDVEFDEPATLASTFSTDWESTGNSSFNSLPTHV